MASSLLRFHLPHSPSPRLLLLSSSSLSRNLTPSSSLLIRPFSSPSSIPSPSPHPLLSHSPRLFSSLSSSPSPSYPLQSDQGPVFEEPELDESDEGSQLGDDEKGETRQVVSHAIPRLPSPKLSIKEKKELASYAHSLGKKLKSQQVGKSGVTPSVAAAFVENLEANELLKLKVHGSCPGEMNDIVKQLEQATGSVAVGQIGRSVILYRPSLSKMQKEKQKRQTDNSRNAWNAKSSKVLSTSKMQTKKKVFARGSRGACAL